MNPLVATIWMPVWVFLVLFFGGLGLLTFLMWANHTQAHDIRRQRREIRALRGQEDLEQLASVFDADPLHDEHTGLTYLVPRPREGGRS